MEQVQQKDEAVTYFAETVFRDKREKFGIKAKDRRTHMYVIGKTGVGKSTLLGNLAHADVQAGNGLALLDPHADLVKSLLQSVPDDRMRDVVCFDPTDAHNPVRLNVFDHNHVDERALIASSVVSIFKKLFPDSWGPRSEHLLRGAALALLEYPGASLLDAPRFLLDDGFRDDVLEHVTNSEVINLWDAEFAGYAKRFRNEAVSPILNKIGAFLTNPILQRIISSGERGIDVREIMDHKKILLVNLSRGKLGEDVSGLLGALLVTKIHLAALSRLQLPQTERSDFYVYIDEFQYFATRSFVEMPAELRKVGVNLILSHQFTSQLPEPVRDAVLGNVGTIIAFRLGAKDAQIMAEEFFPTIKKGDFISLVRYRIYLRMMIDGVMSEPFSAVTLPGQLLLNSRRFRRQNLSPERFLSGIERN